MRLCIRRDICFASWQNQIPRGMNETADAEFFCQFILHLIYDFLLLYVCIVYLCISFCWGFPLKGKEAKKDFVKASAVSQRFPRSHWNHRSLFPCLIETTETASAVALRLRNPNISNDYLGEYEAIFKTILAPRGKVWRKTARVENIVTLSLKCCDFSKILQYFCIWRLKGTIHCCCFFSRRKLKGAVLAAVSSPKWTMFDTEPIRWDQKMAKVLQVYCKNNF
jgi:hypothetical protein